MKIALVHDYLVQYGGAEQVLKCFTEIFPHAAIYTILYDEEAVHGVFRDKRIYTSYLQKIPFSRSKHRLFPLLMPSAIEQFDFSKYDIVLSDSSAFAKGIITGPETLHICYMHTPMRYVWDDCQKYVSEFSFPGIIRKSVPLLTSPLRLWDSVSAERPDEIIANSTFVSERIKKYYRRESSIIHPPVDMKRFFVSDTQKDYFLMVGRLISYKRFDMAIRAFNTLGLPLKIIGRGPEMNKLKKLAKDNIEFIGRASDEKLAKYYAECKAFIFPQEEDFGIVAIEALASGRPVIAYNGGDIPRHIEEGKSGLFFPEQTEASLREAVGRFRQEDFSGAYLRSIAEKFDRETFKKTIREYVEKAFREHK